MAEASFNSSLKVIDKLEKLFEFEDLRDKYLSGEFEIITFKGRQDADEYRWFTIGLSPQINSRLTMTDFIKNKLATYSYHSYNSHDGVIIDEGFGLRQWEKKTQYTNPSDKPKFD